ncbi:ABC-type transport system, involved in lipoprotein release, permease component [Sphaerochaeta pleomorpha str. Grapes]|uniref:ABC-type transport system, involved in lipoprotein release, permease component n=1 Tax=Sphaerochaeta pleomorpha (strain ATCC BAA-1885 / DSM 22778 / Grapes) TaxID=158190 RepID=G8QQR1_SPHPG|nr:ABC transporter permease [Sphaerochaeta pleomorpha]AEV28692.1 ABC-type transport system, involved in lipoprotein release, permease component [Sphaerochaeta pleomorpha str. Grapes]
MFSRIIRNDIKSSKLMTAAIFLIITSAAVLVSLTVMLSVNLSGAVDALMVQAKTPHFMQMHSGPIDMLRLDDFAKQNTLVEEYQVAKFLNIEGSQIVINGKSLVDSVQDNGFSMQNDKFDYLMDFDGNVIQVTDGFIYLPIYCMKDKLAQVGDMVTVAGKPFVVAGFLRDSQMNSLLSSSKRFLVSSSDYAQLASSGNVEYLIEFRLFDLSQLGSFENTYTAAGLEANGPTITYPLFKLINVISDGLMVAIILLVSVLILAIAFLCIRLTLLAKIEDDYREIGVMKAIGLRVSDIRGLYFAKYAAIAALSCILGYVLSLPLQDFMLRNIRLFLGESQNAAIAPLVSVFGIAVVFTAITTYVNHVLRRFKHLSAADALRYRGEPSCKTGARGFTLGKGRILGANVFLGLKDVLARKHLYATMFIVLVLATFIMLVPQNLYTTISSKSFITYMGMGSCDLRLDLQQVSDIPRKAGEIAKAMETDETIDSFVVLFTKRFEVPMADGTVENLNVELGDHSVFPVTYAKGNAPANPGEIALSSINAVELDKTIGDTLVLKDDGKERSLTVCGIYSDITNGGKTAKATFSSSLDSVLWGVIAARLQDPGIVLLVAKTYSNRFTYAKVSGVGQYIEQTFGSTMGSIKKASVAAMIVSLLVSALIASLFIKMLIAKDRYPIAVMKALGFTNEDISIQYISRSVFVLFFAIVLGTVLANTLGEFLAGSIIASLGATVFSFVVRPLSAYLISPLLLLSCVILATFLTTSSSGNLSISDTIKE